MSFRLATAPALFVALVVAIASTAAFAQLPAPRLYALSQAGGQAGTTFDISLASAVDTDDARTLVFSHPGITAVPKTLPAAAGKTPVKLDGQFTVTIGKDVPPGVYEVRVAAAMGITNARAFVVGDLAETKDPGGNRSIEAAAPLAPNTTINGTFTARQLNYYKLALKQNQRILLDCKAERIDSRGNAVLTLTAPNGKEIARQRAGNGLDPLIDFTAPADGDYLVTVNDLTFAGGEQFFYRLTARTGPYIDYVFPPAGLPGSKTKFTLFGRNLPGSAKSDQMSLDGIALEALTVEIDIPADRVGRSEIDQLVLPAEAATDAFVYRLSSPQGSSNAVRIGIASAPVTLETEPNDDPAKAMKVSIPCEIAGRFLPRADRDWFTFEAKKGEVLWIDVYAQRIGVPADAVLLIQQVKKTDKGEEVKDLQSIDDSADKPDPRLPAGTEDPSLRFVVPEDGVYRIGVRDQYASGKADPRRVYRLTIQPESKEASVVHAAAPDFRLVIAPQVVYADKGNKNTYDTGSTVVRRGGADDLAVLIYRRGGFAGDVALAVEGLPAGVSCDPVTIAAGATSATLVFRAAADSPAWSGLIRIVGKATVHGKELTREARGAQIVWGPVNDKSRGWSRMAGSIALSVIDSEGVPFSVSFENSASHELSRMGKVNVPVKVQRHDGFKGAIKVTANAGMQNAPVAGKEVTIAADKNEGVIEIDVKQTAAIQGYSLFVSAESAIQYARMPKLADSLNAQKKELEESVKALTEESKKAKEAAAAAVKSAKDAEEAHKKAKPEEAGESQKKIEAANAVKTDAEAKAKAAEDQLKMAADMLKMIDAQAKKATEGAKPKAVTLSQPVGTISIRVLESPVKLEAAPEAKLKVSGNVEHIIKVARNSGFDGDVTFELKLPDGVTGITLASPAIAKKGEGETKLVIAASDKATVGSHTILVRSKVSFGGQELRTEIPVKVDVEK